MRCPQSDLLFEAHGDRAVFQKHALDCPDCGALFALHAKTYAVLAGETPPLEDFERTRVWARIDSAREQPRIFEWQLTFAAAALAASALYIFAVSRSSPEATKSAAPAVVMDEWIELPKTRALELPGVRIAANEATKALFESSDVAREMRVFRGVVTITAELDTPPAMVLETPRVRIVALAAKYRVEVSKERTAIAVQSGEVEAVSSSGGKRRLRAGESLELVDEPEPTAPIEPIAPVIKRDSNAQDIAAARALIGRDDKRASELAERVLERQPTTKDEVEALMIAADAHRRSRELDKAEARYGRVIAHSEGAAYREEAQLRRAAVLAELSRPREAIRVLESAAESGNLVPERAALEARLRLDQGDVEGAARVLDTLRERRDRVLEPIRRDVERMMNSKRTGTQ